MTGPEPPREVELDGTGDHVARHLSTLASTGMATTQIASQQSATRARAEQAALRDQQHTADRQTRAAQTAQRDQQRIAEQHARAVTTARHAQWRLQPTTGWLYDDPTGAARAWRLANLNRSTDPLAARHAAAWETVFTRDGLHVPALRAADSADAEALIVNAARAAAPSQPPPPREASPAPADSPEPAAPADSPADHATTTTEPAATTATEASAETAVETGAEIAAAAAAAGWTAYADGAPAAALGGAGVSHPTTDVLPAARATPDSAASATAAASPHIAPGHGADPTHAHGLEQ